jgi:hypothetical protein
LAWQVAISCPNQATDRPTRAHYPHSPYGGKHWVIIIFSHPLDRKDKSIYYLFTSARSKKTPEVAKEYLKKSNNFSLKSILIFMPVFISLASIRHVVLESAHILS